MKSKKWENGDFSLKQSPPYVFSIAFFGLPDAGGMVGDGFKAGELGALF
ncbi:MAG TPA: hypothetical protein GXX19_10880 [Syntrophomonadaceae bacterium]|nr:hypothetical protein [Syntrophomonadaceae bacterium]